MPLHRAHSPCIELTAPASSSRPLHRAHGSHSGSSCVLTRYAQRTLRSTRSPSQLVDDYRSRSRRKALSSSRSQRVRKLCCLSDTRHDVDISVQLFADANVRLYEAAERSTMESTGFFTGETCMEQHFRGMETCSAERDAVSFCVPLVFSMSVSDVDLSCVVVHATDISSNLPYCGGMKAYPCSMKLFVKYSARSRPATRMMA